jgi:hypothetical protein
MYFDRFPPWRQQTGSSLLEWFLLFSTGYFDRFQLTEGQPVHIDRFPPLQQQTGNSLPEWFLLFSTGFIREEPTNILLYKRDFFPPEQRRKTVDMDWLTLSELKSNGKKTMGNNRNHPRKLLPVYCRHGGKRSKVHCGAKDS